MAEFNMDKMAKKVAEKAMEELRDNGVFVGVWIPIKTRPMTEEEITYYRDWAEYGAEIFDCPLPEDGDTVLITDRLGNVEVDTFINDGDGCYFECNCDMDDVVAWTPLPEPYKEGESE